MDDCLSGSDSYGQTLRITDELQVALKGGGGTLKGFTISGSKPSEHPSSDLESVVVAGLKSFPKGDFIKMNTSEINFAKKERGRKPLHKKGCIPDKLTKRVVSQTS